MRICLYETSHHETALAMLRLLDPGCSEVTVFTTGTVSAHLHAALGSDAERISWILRGKDEPERKFIGRMKAHCRVYGPDVLLLETVESNHYPIAQALSGLDHTTVLLTIHDVHANFRSRIRPSLRGLVRHFGKKALLARVQGFIALSSRVAEHLRGFVEDGRPVSWVPGSIFIPATFVPVTLAKDEQIRLVVSGSYDMRRRDYDRVFRLAAQWEELGMRIHLDLLGGPGPDAQEILARCASWRGEYVRIMSFGRQEVPEPEFTRHMQAAHFVWVPSVIRTILGDGVEETYGVSKSSGNLFDAIRYARPLLVPAALQVDPLQEAACFHYDSDEALTGFLRNLGAGPLAYTELLQHAVTVSGMYTADKIRARAPELAYLFRPD